MAAMTKEFTPHGHAYEPDFWAVVKEKVDVSRGVVALALARPKGDDAEGNDLPAWQPGSHIDMVFEGGLVRQYSLCGDPADRSTYRIGVLREVAGRGGSEFVHDRLQVGDRVHLRGPRNHFVLQEAPAYLFVAGGIGITPLLPMVAEAQRRGADWSLLYGGRSRGSMAFLDQLEAYGDRVAVMPEDERGLLDLKGFLGGHSAGALVYSCGPEPLLKAMEAACADLPHNTLRVERFAPKEEFHTDTDTDFEVYLQQSDLTVQVGPDQSILECVESAGIPILSSCQEGTCGTCETDVIEGIPEHRDSVLTEDDRASNETMMICVGRCKGKRLVLDL